MVTRDLLNPDALIGFQGGGASSLLDEIIDQVEQPGWGERMYYAEEQNFLTSLTWARRQQAKS